MNLRDGTRNSSNVARTELPSASRTTGRILSASSSWRANGACTGARVATSRKPVVNVIRAGCLERAPSGSA